MTPDDTLLLSYEGYGDEKNSRKKAVLHHKASIFLIMISLLKLLGQNILLIIMVTTGMFRSLWQLIFPQLLLTLIEAIICALIT